MVVQPPLCTDCTSYRLHWIVSLKHDSLLSSTLHGFGGAARSLVSLLCLQESEQRTEYNTGTIPAPAASSCPNWLSGCCAAPRGAAPWLWALPACPAWFAALLVSVAREWSRCEAAARPQAADTMSSYTCRACCVSLARHREMIKSDPAARVMAAPVDRSSLCIRTTAVDLRIQRCS